MWNTNGSQSSASLSSATPDCSGQLSCWWSRANHPDLHLRFLFDTWIRSCILRNKQRFSLHYLMRFHKVLSCAIHRFSFLRHGMNDNAECSHLYQIWPEEASSVEWSSTKRHSATVQYLRWSIHDRRCQVTTSSSILKYEARVSGFNGFQITWENVVDGHQLISQSAEIILQSFYSNFRLGSLK